MKKTVRQLKKGDIIFYDKTYYKVSGFRREARLERLIGDGSVVSFTQWKDDYTGEEKKYTIIDKDEFELIKLAQ
jgi:hypothetical protein